MNLHENIDRIKKVMGLRESMKVDDWGRLHDEESKIEYPYKSVAKFLNWFEKEYGDYVKKQGWFVVTSDTDVPKTKYKPEKGNKYNLFFQVQRIDDPMEGEALFGKLKNDHQADELAKKIGLMLDEFGVVIGWDGESFLPQKGEQIESEITERCWKGYTQKGMKTMFGKRYPNCVKKKK